MKILDIIKNTKTPITEGVYDPSILKVFFLAGGPGSGKTFVAGKVTAGHGLKFINSDVYFEKLLRQSDLGMDLANMSPEKFSAAMQLRDRAKASAGKTEQNYLEGRLGIIYDGTGDNYAKIKNLRDKCTELGYDTYMIFVNTSLDIALARNQARERSVPEDIVIDSWQQVQNNIGKFQNLFGRPNMIVVDNNEFREDVLEKVWKQVRRLIKEPIRNPLGKKWIELQLAIKKRNSNGSEGV